MVFLVIRHVSCGLSRAFLIIPFTESEIIQKDTTSLAPANISSNSLALISNQATPFKKFKKFASIRVVTGQIIVHDQFHYIC